MATFGISTRTDRARNDGAETMSETDTVKRPLVIMVGADKGGVGKTTVARVVDDYLAGRGLARKVFDTEYPAGDLVKFAPAASIVDIQKIDDQMQVFDSISGITLIDIRAGVLSPTLKALDDVGLLADVRSGALALALLHVVGPSVASLAEIAATSASIGGGVRHFLVKNHINESGYAEWETDARFAAVLKQAAPYTINVPNLIGRACTEIQQKGGSFAAYAAARQSTMLAGHVGNWLKKIFAEFDRVGLGDLVSAAA